MYPNRANYEQVFKPSIVDSENVCKPCRLKRSGAEQSRLWKFICADQSQLWQSIRADSALEWLDLTHMSSQGYQTNVIMNLIPIFTNLNEVESNSILFYVCIISTNLLLQLPPIEVGKLQRWRLPVNNNINKLFVEVNKQNRWLSFHSHTTPPVSRCLERFRNWNDKFRKSFFESSFGHRCPFLVSGWKRWDWWDYREWEYECVREKERVR